MLYTFEEALYNPVGVEGDGALGVLEDHVGGEHRPLTALQPQPE